MNAREERGLVIAALCKLNRTPEGWLVPSQSGERIYTVDPDKQTCTCPDHQEAGFKCKHLFAAEIVIKREVGSKDIVAACEEAEQQSDYQRESIASRRRLRAGRRRGAASAQRAGAVFSPEAGARPFQRQQRLLPNGRTVGSDGDQRSDRPAVPGDDRRLAFFCRFEQLRKLVARFFGAFALCCSHAEPYSTVRNLESS